MAISMTRRRDLLRLVFGERDAYPLTDAPGDEERMLINGVKVTQGLVNAWMSHSWCQLRVRAGGGSELALTPLGVRIVEEPVEGDSDA